MNRRLLDICELSMILGVRDQICLSNKPPIGRIKSLLDRLSKAISKELDGYGFISDEDVKACLNVLDSFDRVAGWPKKGRNIRSMLAFFLGFSDKWDKINSILIDLYSYFDRHDKGVPVLCDISGERLLKIWSDISIEK